MTRTSKTRSALFTSIISLLLCVSMLVGTTFAWFTDTVTSGVNTIAAGNLDVELYHDKENKFEDLDNAKVNESTLLFTDADGEVIKNWEPGVVAFTNLKVANVGTLALKYQLSVNSTEMNYVEVDGVQYTLADALKVAVIEGGVTGTREQVIAAATANGWDALKSFVKSGELEGNETSKTYGIVVYWQPGENAYDNIFNLNNGKHTNNNEPLSITLGVNLFATQEMYENDSFGPDYDKDAWVDGFDVYSAQDLQAAINNGETTIDLMDNIEAIEAIEIPEGVTVALNLNGKAISGAGLDVEGKKVHTLVNNGTLTVVDGTVESTGTNGGSAIYNKGKLTLENVTVVGAPSDTSVGTASYAVNTVGAGSSLTVYNSNISGRGAIAATEGTKVEINGGTYHTPAVAWGHAVYASGEGVEVVINGGTFSEGYEMAADNWGMYQIYSGDKAKVIVNGGNFQPWDCANGYDLCTASEGVIEIYGGTFAENPARQNNNNYVAEGGSVTEYEGTYYVASPGTEYVKTGTSLKNALEDGKTAILLTDISMGNKTIVIPADKESTLDLNGHTVSQKQTYTTTNAMITNKGTLTIKDSVGTGKISYTDTGVGGEYASNTIRNDGVLTILGGTLENLSSAEVATNGYPHVIDTYSGSTTTIEGGKLYGANYSAIRMFCNSTTANNVVTINGGEIVGRVDFQNPNRNKNLGELTINGGSFTANNSRNWSMFVFGGGATDGTGMNLTINGGTFDGKIEANYPSFDIGEGFDYGFITGGTFNTMEVLNYLAEGANVTVSLTEDVVMDAPVTVPASATAVLNLNGKKVSYDSTTQNESMITNKGNLTINDSIGGGEIYYNYTGAADPSFSKGNNTISNGGTLTVNGGKIHIAKLSNHAKYPIDNNSTTGDAVLVINGGHLYNYNTMAIRQFCNSTTYKNSVTINGGLLEAYSVVWMQNPNNKTVNGQLTITGGELRSTAKAYVEGTSELKDVASKLYCSTAGGAWSTDSFVSISGGVINENINLAEQAPANITCEGATFNGYVALP